MSGVRRGARSVLKWLSPLYVVLIIVQVFLAGEASCHAEVAYGLGDGLTPDTG